MGPFSSMQSGDAHRLPGKDAANPVFRLIVAATALVRAG